MSPYYSNCFRNFVVISALIACTHAYSATPEAPVIVCDDCSSSSSLYDLYATDTQARGTIPFEVNWPDLPRNTSSVQVNNVQELLSAWGSNRRIVLSSPGVYDLGSQTLSLNGLSDIELVIPSGTTLTANGDVVRASGRGAERVTSRFHLHGGGSITGGIAVSNATDVLIDGITYDDVSSNNAMWNNNRLAWVNSYIRQDGFTIFLIADSPVSDIIIANNNIVNIDGGTGRVPIRAGSEGMDMNRVIIVDNRFYSGGGAGETMRAHGNNTRNLWFRNNQCEGGGLKFTAATGRGATNFGDEINNLWLYDTRLYALYGRTGIEYEELYNFTAAGNIFYDSSASPNAAVMFFGDENSRGQEGWSIESTRYEAYQDPPSWNIR